MGHKPSQLFTIPVNPYVMTRDLKRHTLDTYTTPLALARHMLRETLKRLSAELVQSFSEENPLLVLDLGAGPGIIGAAAHDELVRAGIPHKITGVELNPAYPKQIGYNEWICADVLNPEGKLPNAHIVIMNPPFVHGEKFVTAAIGVLLDGGLVCALLPDHFEFYAVRDEFFAKHHYVDRLVLNRRPSFFHALISGNEHFANENGVAPSGTDTDARHYCLFFFDKEERAATHRLSWEYDDDPLTKVLQQSRSMAIYALIYEASMAKEGDVCYDDIWSMLASRRFGWDFFSVTAEGREAMRKAVQEEYSGPKD